MLSFLQVCTGGHGFCTPPNASERLARKLKVKRVCSISKLRMAFKQTRLNPCRAFPRDKDLDVFPNPYRSFPTDKDLGVFPK